MKRGALIVAMVMVVLVWVVFMQVTAQSPEPTFTEVQSLKLQLFDQQMQTIQAQRVLLQQAETEVRRNRADLLTAIEQSYPGWTIHRETLKWEKVPVPPASKK